MKAIITTKYNKVENTDKGIVAFQLVKPTNLTNKIGQTLTLIEQQTGLRLDLCDHFIGVRFFNDKPYFNVVLKDKISESFAYNKLKWWSDKYRIQIENNGLKRIAVFI